MSFQDYGVEEEVVMNLEQGLVNEWKAPYTFYSVYPGQGNISYRNLAYSYEKPDWTQEGPNGRTQISVEKSAFVDPNDNRMKKSVYNMTRRVGQFVADQFLEWNRDPLKIVRKELDRSINRAEGLISSFISDDLFTPTLVEYCQSDIPIATQMNLIIKRAEYTADVEWSPDRILGESSFFKRCLLAWKIVCGSVFGVWHPDELAFISNKIYKTFRSNFGETFSLNSDSLMNFITSSFSRMLVTDYGANRTIYLFNLARILPLLVIYSTLAPNPLQGRIESTVNLEISRMEDVVTSGVTSLYWNSYYDVTHAFGIEKSIPFIIDGSNRGIAYTPLRIIRTHKIPNIVVNPQRLSSSYVTPDWSSTPILATSQGYQNLTKEKDECKWALINSESNQLWAKSSIAMWQPLMNELVLLGKPLYVNLGFVPFEYSLLVGNVPLYGTRLRIFDTPQKYIRVKTPWSFRMFKLLTRVSTSSGSRFGIVNTLSKDMDYVYHKDEVSGLIRLQDWSLDDIINKGGAIARIKDLFNELKKQEPTKVDPIMMQLIRKGGNFRRLTYMDLNLEDNFEDDDEQTDVESEITEPEDTSNG